MKETTAPFVSITTIAVVFISSIPFVNGAFITTPYSHLQWKGTTLPQHTITISSSKQNDDFSEPFQFPEEVLQSLTQDEMNEEGAMENLNEKYDGGVVYKKAQFYTTPQRAAADNESPTTNENNADEKRREWGASGAPGSLEIIASAVALFFIATVLFTGGTIFSSTSTPSGISSSTATRRRIVIDPDALLREDFVKEGSSILFNEAVGSTASETKKNDQNDEL